MATEKKQYTEEYRREAADYALASDKPYRQVARELGINYKTFSNWVLKRKRELQGGSSLESPSDSPEIRELKRRNKELEMENEFLKKASAFFAKNQK